jgi:L-asparaginase II
MLAETVRSGLVEATHDGAVAVCGPDGELIASSGDIDRPYFIRSASKPFQAWVSQHLGADLPPLQLALACSSHRGHPSQVAIVGRMLEEMGLDEGDLGCPADWPISRVAARQVLAAGATIPRRLWNNCSGKHAGFLRACVASGMSTADYLDPSHPLQRRVSDLIAEIGGSDPEPVGVDGCGAPVHRTTARVMARMFAVLATDSAFGEIYRAMHRYPAMVGGNGEADSSIATAIDGVAKGGAQGCIGVGLASGVGLAAKAWDGSGVIAAAAAVNALEDLGMLNVVASSRLMGVGRPPVLGGGKPVGAIESRLRLEIA